MSGRLRVQDLPPWLQLVMLITQSVLGLIVGMLLGHVVRRAFLTGYVILSNPAPKKSRKRR